MRPVVQIQAYVAGLNPGFDRLMHAAIDAEALQPVEDAESSFLATTVSKDV